MLFIHAHDGTHSNAEITGKIIWRFLAWNMFQCLLSVGYRRSPKEIFAYVKVQTLKIKDDKIRRLSRVR